ncbi:Spherulation-specific family 4 [Crucibulum laeve]|uniref:Spherulation-specific family 4 n=1 Tax=Crucibulum laeve TaxID=68775 RepID=A0A5C3LP20_9AGAR|nr:Spherulation-specific family 4 [Crucibulum laeve]
MFAGIRASSFRVLWAALAFSLYFGHTLALLPTGVIVPLYIYPGTCTDWAFLINAIQSYPTIQFYVIINPNSGPGGAPGTQPDTNYQSCTASIRRAGASAGNAKLLGYVATGYGSRTNATVTSDVDTYSQWTVSYRPDGIFFDEVATAASSLSLYQAFSNRVHQNFGANGLVFLNPGTTPETSGYFNIANLIVTYEDTYNGYSSSSLTITTNSPANKQSVILHTGPAQLPLSIVQQLTSTGLGAIFITNYPSADAYSFAPSYWSTFLSYIVSSQ